MPKLRTIQRDPSLWETCVHEAGHILVCDHLGGEVHTAHITCPFKAYVNYTCRSYLDTICVLMAGYAAHRRISKLALCWAADDMWQCDNLIRKVRTVRAEERRAAIDHQTSRANIIVSRNLHQLHTIAKGLYDDYCCRIGE